MVMNLSYDVPTPLDYFASLVQSDGNFALFEAAVSLAQDEYPELDVQAVLADVDQLLERVRRRLPADAGQLQRLRVLNQFFFNDLGFGGNLNNYYDPDNSFVHELLRTRRGIPISLALLWMELAQGLGLVVSGIGFPGHFMVKVNLSMRQAVIDPMSGQSLSSEELAQRLEPYRQRKDQSEDMQAPLGLFLQSAPPRDIVARMLAVQERLIVLLPEAWPEYRDRGLAHAEMGNTEQALADLECHLVHTEDLVDVNAIADRVDTLRRDKD
jgi:regulator of sirC expression with transglutaminase-like and TPR domain